MTPVESERLINDYLTRFPTLWAHVQKSPDPAATIASWRECLADVPYDAADATLSLMVRGRVQPPRAFESDKAAIILREATVIEIGKRDHEVQRDEQLERREQYQAARAVMTEPVMVQAFEDAEAIAARCKGRYGDAWKTHYREAVRKMTAERFPTSGNMQPGDGHGRAAGDDALEKFMEDNGLGPEDMERDL